MRSLAFKYSRLPGKEPAPIIPIQIKGRGGWIKSWAYVDSGATFSIFGRTDAERLGLNIDKSPGAMVTVGDGGQIPVVIYRLPIKVGKIGFQVSIGFSARLGVGFNLIGRKDFFERFDVTFSERKQEIHLTPL